MKRNGPTAGAGRAAAQILFVCTGNICRSPMAAVIARAAMAARLGIAEPDLAHRGVQFRSAGTAAWRGTGPTRQTKRVLARYELRVDGHTATRLDADLVAESTRIFGMAPRHVDAVCSLMPEAGAKTSTLLPDGGTVPDPYGRSTAIYEQVYKTIAAAIEDRLDELITLV